MSEEPERAVEDDLRTLIIALLEICEYQGNEASTVRLIALRALVELMRP